MAEKTQKTVEDVIGEIEAHLADIDGTLLKYAEDRIEDLKTTQHSVDFSKQI